MKWKSKLLSSGLPLEYEVASKRQNDRENDRGTGLIAGIRIESAY